MPAGEEAWHLLGKHTTTNQRPNPRVLVLLTFRQNLKRNPRIAVFFIK